MTELQVQRLRCEHLADPRGIDRARPRLSWQVTADRAGTTQAAYQLLAASSAQLLEQGRGDLWDTGKVVSDECVLVRYDGPRLVSRQQAFWTVRVWDDRDVVSPYAPTAQWEMGLLDADDWKAVWVAASVPVPGAVSYLRTDVTVTGPILRARAYVTARGLYELHCNGRRVGDARFTPGWTDYRKRQQYQVLDLTDLLVPGVNAIGAVLADGWYAGYVGFQGAREHYGNRPSLLVQVEVDTDAGRSTFVSDGSWTAGAGEIVRTDMLKGEQVDERLAVTDWSRTGGAPEWEPVTVVVPSQACLVTSPGPPVRVLVELAAVTVQHVEGVHRIDFGQNLVGWVRLSVVAPSGASVTVRHAEVLRPDGSLYVDNLRTADATDSYVLAGGQTVLEPRFTFHGFRYAEVSGDFELLTATAVVVGSDLERVGEFSCSDESITRLHENIVWGARGNFLDIPTDCPQRDERMGWTGDAQVFAPTACYLFDTAAFFTKWLRDLVDGQSPDGSFPDVAPLVVLAPEGSAGWADAGVVIPALLQEVYADLELLAELFPAMCRWVEYVHRANPNLLWLNARGYDNGDWLSAHAETDKDLIASACFARTTRLTAQAAVVLVRPEAAELEALADGVLAAFQQAHVLRDGRLTSSTQTAYSMCLRFGLIPDALRALAAQHLADDVIDHDTHLTTGFQGVGELLPALTDTGHVELAYRLLHQDSYPSWLHAVRAGATTIWERWDGWTAEHGFGDPAMNSYNHYALGSVGAWLYRSLAGIGYTAPGGRRLRIEPTPDRSLAWARASHRCSYGLIRSQWRWIGEGGLLVEVEVPVGATAEIRLPDGSVVERSSGSYQFRVSSPSEIM